MSERLPFDPKRMKKRSSPKQSGDEPVSVSALAARIGRAVSDAFPQKVRVLAEISAVTHRTHYYFAVKDEHASIGAVMFASAAARSKVVPAHGDQAVLTGKLDYYAPSGRLSLVVEKIEPVGAGALERMLKERLEEARSLGWLDPESKRALPLFPRTVAVVTSATGAALQDVIATASKRCPAVRIAPVDVRVQGERTVAEVMRALSFVTKHAVRERIDAVILTRGGGSLEDLWSFNDMDLARAVRGCGVPVVAAIGHETDTTIAELAADARASTPTQAALMVVPDAAALSEQLGSLGRRASREIEGLVEAERERLERLATRSPLARAAALTSPARDSLVGLARALTGSSERVVSSRRVRLERLGSRLAQHQPGAVHARRAARVEALGDRIERATRVTLERSKELAFSLERELVAIDPLRVLGRGFTVTTRPDGSLVREAGGVSGGEPLLTRFSDGSVRSVVEGGDPERADAPSHDTAPKRRRARRKGADPDQMGLF